eukprot:TRINITY_DN12575_c0_g1_i13.p1 TRINITY_DN12575_c0_g1~~TRINITY_DN12575_c0_g1_i13.p1  ORF type:complete len:252 (+),score=39.72 TRINITY_DN12575_c0_g1_i13:72-827(+)
MCIRDRHGKMDFDIAKGAVEAQSREVAGASRIDWSDCNFPPLLKLAHFSISELQGTLKRFAVMLYIAFLIVFAIQWINLLSCIIQTKYTYKLHIFYSILNLFILSIAAGFVLYKGYAGACRRPVDARSVLWYRICQAIACVLWLVFSIVRAGPFNGWSRIGLLDDYKESAARFCIFLTVLESLGYTATTVIGIVGILQISSVVFEVTLDDCGKHRNAVSDACQSIISHPHRLPMFLPVSYTHLTLPTICSV